MSNSPTLLAGTTVLVTGVSRRRGIGYGIATALAAHGANLFLHHYSPHDARQPWGTDDIDALLAELEAEFPGSVIGDASLDLGELGAPRHLIDRATDSAGRLDALVCNHAQSGGDGSIFDVDEQMLDSHWRTNARSVLMLTRYFAEQYTPQPRSTETAPGQHQRRVPQDEFGTGKVIWLTSGQIHGPLAGEVAYGTSKAALAGITATVCSDLLSRNVSLNTIEPGPVNTGYMDPDTADRPLDELREMESRVPFGRFGTPADVGRLVAWLLSADARWIVGQVLTSDGGVRL